MPLVTSQGERSESTPAGPHPHVSDTVGVVLTANRLAGLCDVLENLACAPNIPSSAAARRSQSVLDRLLEDLAAVLSGLPAAKLAELVGRDAEDTATPWPCDEQYVVAVSVMRLLDTVLEEPIRRGCGDLSDADHVDPDSRSRHAGSTYI